MLASRPPREPRGSPSGPGPRSESLARCLDGNPGRSNAVAVKRRKSLSVDAQVSRLGPLVEAVVNAVLDTPGSTAPDVRRRVRDASGAADAAGGADAAGEDLLPQSRAASARAASYLATVRQHAYRVVDGDVEGLTLAGLDDDAVFELTAAAALGEAQRRLDAGLSALKA